MKYIRTKDGIFERKFPNKEQQISFDHKTIEPAYYTVKYDWIAKKDVIKQSDTIEELCDEFIGVWKHCCDGEEKHCDECYYIKEKNIFYYAELEYKHKDILYLFDMFYGAIWTDKGLIYVARMNKEGKWELL